MKKTIKFIYIFLIIGLESLGNMGAVTTVLEENLVKKNKLVKRRRYYRCNLNGKIRAWCYNCQCSCFFRK